ncbi:MAG: DUF2924 domain-containing protein, partial [Planctomycetes bacterium]|nr:DUF2924 domain-containing protein [Planctomycetota bacterium]
MAMEIGKQLAELTQMTVRELREKYHGVFGEPTRSGNKDFLFKRIAWRIQSLAEGSLTERARRRAGVLARDADLRTTAPRTPVALPDGSSVKDAQPASSLADERVPPPGAVLTRVYRGQACHVVVRDDGFEYDGEAFRSLSAIAKKITGSHWNGLLFFKIAKPKAGVTAKKARTDAVTT